jgi:phosphoribosylformylglycinamidine cyclo-ligase
MSLRYEDTGVDYSSLDAFKRACQQLAGTTAPPAPFVQAPNTRGESAYLLETADAYWAHVEEGLGTKNLIADAMLKLTGKSYYHAIGVDTVATIVNDLITTGARAVSVAMHAAVGDSGWFRNEQRSRDLAQGFADACKESGAVWGGGETPALKDIVNPETIVLAGSAFGVIAPKSNRITGDVRDGDAIVFLASSGVQTNGLTLCRAIAEKLPQEYLTKMPDGRSYGEALLDPSVIYAKFVAAAQQRSLGLHYVAHITGHGWRKLMRLEEPFVYRIETVRPAPAIFDFLMNSGPVDVREMYATFNMGAGFAAYVAAHDAQRCVDLARDAGYSAWIAGTVRKDGKRKAVEIAPLQITFESDTLQVR